MIPIDLSGKVLVVTGGSGTIGAGIAARGVEAGATVVIQRHHGEPPPLPAATAVRVDLTDTDGPGAVIDAALDAHGRVDALVNAAGVQDTALLADVTPAEWDLTMSTNVTAAHRLTQAVARHVAARDGGGCVVHVASIEGHRPAPNHGHYGTSKAALLAYVRAAAAEFGALGLRVNSVSPGLIDRPGLADDWPEGVARWHRAAPLHRLGTARDVADACLFLCCDLGTWITGTDLAVDGGVLAGSAW